MRPADEAVQTAAPRDEFVARAEEQVIGVAEDDVGARLGDVAVQRRLDRALRAHRHEGGRLHHAVRRLELAAARAVVGTVETEAK